MTHVLAPQRILLVDDEPNLRASLATTLLAEGYEVIEAKDGQEALEKLEYQTVDLILTDIHMPRRSGIELFHEVRRRHPGVPVVMMTAFANEHLIEDVLAAGVFTVIDKPFDIAPMLQLVASALTNPLILVVDRSVEETTAILQALSAVGLRAKAAPDAATAIQMLQDKRVDACVLDLEMADALLSAGVVEDRLHPIRVIAITGPNHAELLSQTGQFAGETCLRRPLILAEVVRSIARARQASMQPPVPRSAPAQEPSPTDNLRQEMRHALSNRLLVIRASAYYLQRAAERSGLYLSDPQVAQMFLLIDDAIRGSVSYLDEGIPNAKKSAADLPAESGPAAQPPLPCQLQVLIVDDTENNRRALQSVLEDLELRVDAASSLAEARTLLAAPDARYRLVVLDQHLGDGLGTDLVALIRERQPAARILLLSGSVSEESMQKESTKVDAHLAKGRDIQELLSVIAELLT